jgi:cephalosporin hydroxylase
MNPIESFNNEKEKSIQEISKDAEMQKLGVDFMVDTAKHKYTYNFTWMGRPIIAFPQDMIAMQEIIWEVKPDLIIETGVAHGGSIVYYASLLELIGGDGLVVGIDIDIRKHNRDLIEAHPMMKRIQLIEGSSTSKEVADQVKLIAKDKKRIMICLDSNHTHEHVLEELKIYAPLTTKGSYCVVFDTGVEDFPEDYDWGIRPWGKGNNPKTAVWEYLKVINEEKITGMDNEALSFEINKKIDSKLLITVASDGYLKRV